MARPAGAREPADSVSANDEPELSADALGRLEQRLDRASQAAERLIAAAAAQAVGKPPPAGWQQPPPEAAPDAGGSGDRGRTELELLAQVIGSLRERIPAELAHRLAEALRELLLAVRALIDWYLERSERRRSAPAEVHDIPIL